MINSIINSSNNDYNNLNEDDLIWLPDNIKNGCSGPVQVKLLCGADLLESFGTPGLWSDEDVSRKGQLQASAVGSNVISR